MKKLILHNFLILLITFNSCTSRNYQYTTEIFEDGSCIRTMSAIVDSGETGSLVFDVIVDTSWEKKLRVIDTLQNISELSVSRKFAKVNDINHLKPNDRCNLSKVEHGLHFEKNIKWFYTYFTYTENYKKIIPYNQVPVTEYFSDEELKYIEEDTSGFLKGKDSIEISRIKDTLSLKLVKWLNESIYEDFIQTLSKNAHLLENPAITPQTIKEKKQELWLKIPHKKDDIDFVMYEVDSMLNYCSSIFNSESFKRLSPSKSHAFDQYLKNGEKIVSFFIVEDIDNTVIMPGKITKSNINQADGNKISWNFTVMKCFFKDYKVSVTSKLTNYGAFAVTSILFTILVFVLIWKPYRKREIS
ncbi:MAG: hypothetical protein U0W24_10290 [Bacteroidales bacterium]